MAFLRTPPVYSDTQHTRRFLTFIILNFFILKTYRNDAATWDQVLNKRE
jgi:hypothetical protein